MACKIEQHDSLGNSTMCDVIQDKLNVATVLSKQ